MDLFFLIAVLPHFSPSCEYWASSGPPPRTPSPCSPPWPWTWGQTLTSPCCGRGMRSRRDQHSYTPAPPAETWKMLNLVSISQKSQLKHNFIFSFCKLSFEIFLRVWDTHILYWNIRGYLFARLYLSVTNFLVWHQISFSFWAACSAVYW